MRKILKMIIGKDDERSYDETHGKPHENNYKCAVNTAVKNDFKTGLAVDLGCGSGYGLEIMATEYDHVIGFDYSPTAIMYTQNYRNKEKIDSYVWELPDIPLIDGCVDLVTSIDNFEHIDACDAVEYIQEAHRVLAPGGMMFLTTPTACTPKAATFHKKHYTLKELAAIFDAVFDNDLGRVMQQGIVLIATWRKSYETV